MSMSLNQIQNIPPELKGKPNWLVWRLTHVPGESKPRKVPSYANGAKRSGTQGSDEDRAQLVTFDRALAACRAGDYSGVGIAILPGLGYYALDFDDCVVEGRVDERVLPCCLGTYAEYSPSGTGVRVFLKGDFQSRKDNKNEPQIELFGNSGFVTVTGNVLPECYMAGWGIEPTTPAVDEMIRTRFGAVPAAGSESHELDLISVMQPRLDIGNERVAAVLAKLPSDLHYDDWVKVGMAVHHETDGAGFDLWWAWSQTSPKAGDQAYAKARWESFGKYTGGTHLGFAWVMKLAGETMARETHDAVKGYRQMIAETTDEFELRTRVCSTIQRDERLQSIDRSILVAALKERFAVLGVRLPIADVRKLVAEKREQRMLGEDALPGWASGWVYVTDQDKFLRVGTEEALTKQGFDAKFNREMPRDEHGNVTRAASIACLEDWGMKVVAKALYVPWAAPLFFYEGSECVNRYRPDSAPVPVPSLTPEGLEAVRLFKAHIELICGGRSDVAEMLLAYMAHNVQKPGQKIRWAPVVKGVEGDGKSLIGEVLAGVMGPVNVRSISPRVIGTDFSGWAEGVCIGVLEEIKLTGHNRHDILNALKPYITNSTVEIHRKGRDTYNAQNTQNYLAFTNHADALPLTDTDRRWMVIFTPWSSIDELAARVGDSVSYFNRLFNAIHSHPAELRRWLLDYPIPAGFQPNGRAPSTDEKGEMIALSISDDEDAVRDVIETGGDGVGPNVLSSPCVGKLLDLVRIDRKNLALNRTLLRLGWSKVPGKVKWRSRAHRVWVRGNVPKDADSLRKALDATSNADLF